MRGPPVVLTNTLGRPVTNVISERGAVPMTVVNTLGEPVTLVNSGGEPVTLFNPNGTLWDYPFSLFSNNEQGAWYDPSTFSTLYQDSTGTTPVTAVEQPVGLMLDRSRGLVLGAELKSAWASSGTWAGITGAVFSGSSIDFDATSDRAYTTVTASTTYVLTVGGAFAGGGQIKFDDDGTGVGLGSITNYGPELSAGSVIIFRTTTSTRLRIIQVSVSGTISVTSFSLKELPGNHALQATSASRPVLRARYNLLTYSEQFDNAAWIKSNTGVASVPTVTANAGTAPDGTATADRVQYSLNGGTASGDISNLYQTNTTKGALTHSVYLKSFDGVSSYNMQIIDSTGAGQPITVTGAWQRFSVSATSAGSINYAIRLRGGATPTNSNTADVLIWGAQLLTAADEAATGGAYQRIAAATDYDTSNPVFRPYLAFDGTDDSMATASIDFSATDEMTVFAGISKLSDANTGGLVESGTNALSVNGSWALWAAYSGGGVADFGAISRGTASMVATTAASFPAPTTNVLTSIADISADAISLRVNGVVAATNLGDQGTGNYGNQALFIGRRNNATLPFNGRLYGLTALGRTATSAELSAMEAWVAGKTGVTL